MGVTARFPPPSAFMTTILTSPGGPSRLKAICCPSGDQAGPNSAASGVCVSFRCPLPSAFMT
jgi:hypothetical protein